MEHIFKTKLKYYKKILIQYDDFNDELTYIFENFKYNEGKSKKKIKEHFPTIIFKNANEFIIKHEKENNCSFSLLEGNIELQKQRIKNTIRNRYNCINIFKNVKLLELIKLEHEFKKINKKVFSINTNKNFIKFYDKIDIIKNFPNKFIRKDGEVMFDYIYDIWTENSHHYCDLINLKLCDRIFICCNHENKKYNIMFETSEKVEKLNILKINVENHIKNNYNNI